MEKITTLRVYNLVNANKNRLQLKLGRIEDSSLHGCSGYGDKGYRWSFVGAKIPMPVRNGTWFNGFPEHTMLDWLKGNGWYIQTCVNMHTGKANVFELPNGNDDIPKRYEEDEAAFCNTIRELVRNGKPITAARLYRYANGGAFDDAFLTVKEICIED